MGIWSDIATWRGPTANSGPSLTTHMGIVLHIAEGSYEGTISWCKNPSASVSSHFVAAKDGRLAQLVDTDVQAWTQVDGNASWLSIEHEGYGGDSLTSQQIQNDAKLLARASQVYGVPLVISNSPSVRGLGHHSMGGYAWGGHLQCPGNPIISQKQAIIDAAKAILGQTPVPSGEDEEMDVLMRYGPMPEVFLTDCKQARHVSAAELADIQYLNQEGSIKLGYGGKVRVVGRKSLIGRIIGPVPAGWEDQAD